MSASARVIRPTPLAMRLVGFAGIGVFVVVSTLVSLSDSLDAGGSSFARWGAGLAVWIWLFWSVATSHIAVRGDELLVVDGLLERAIPAAVIGAVQGDNGITISLADGRVVGSLDYGSSLLQGWIPSRRVKLAAQEIDRWRATAPVEHSDGRPVRWRPRRSVLRSLLAAAAAGYAWMLVLWMCADPLRRLLGIGP